LERGFYPRSKDKSGVARAPRRDHGGGWIRVNTSGACKCSFYRQKISPVVELPRFHTAFQVDDQFLISQQDQPPTRRFASKSMSGAVRGEVGTMRVAQTAERWRGVDAESLTGSCAQRRAGAHHAVVGKADEALVEGGIPQGREQETIVNVEALLVVAVRAERRGNRR
jgi:hypothetical protein